MKWMIWSRKRSKRDKTEVAITTAHLLPTPTGTLCGRRVTGDAVPAVTEAKHCSRCEELFLQVRGT